MNRRALFLSLFAAPLVPRPVKREVYSTIAPGTTRYYYMDSLHRMRAPAWQLRQVDCMVQTLKAMR